MYIIMYKYSALKINRKSFPNNIKNPIAPAQRKQSPPSPSSPARPGIPTSSSSASTSTPPETAQNGSMQPDGPATPAKAKQPRTVSPNASTKLQKRTSQTDASEQTTPTTTPTGKKTSTSSATPSAPQSSQRTSSWTIHKTWITSRAELANKPSSTPTSKASPNTSLPSKRHPHHHRHPRPDRGSPNNKPHAATRQHGAFLLSSIKRSSPPALYIKQITLQLVPSDSRRHRK